MIKEIEQQLKAAGCIEMKIRKATLKDRKQVLELVQKFYGKSAQKNVREWKKRYEELIKITLVSEEKKKIIGYIVFICRKSSIYICDIYVLKKYRRKKVGSIFIKKIDNIRKKLRKKYIKGNVRKKDSYAISFYKKNGFKILKTKNEKRLKFVR